MPRSTMGAVAAALAALCAGAPAAFAHEGNPNYRSEVRAIKPAVPGLDARVLNYDDRIELAYDGARTFYVEGYRGEPYLRFHPDGSVERNRRSPAAYLNADRFAQVEPPEKADHKAAPVWEVVARNGRFDWHDHRIHWMSEGTEPPQVRDRAARVKVFDWRIPVNAEGRRANVSGTLVWLGVREDGPPLAALLSLAGALVGGGCMILWVRRRRKTGREAEAW